MAEVEKIKITEDMKKERTIFNAGLRLREAAEGAESRLVEGYALLFGVRSRKLCDWWEDYYEVLERGCVTKEMLDSQDIKLTMFHDRQLILARSNKGAGTLGYEVDEKGVRFFAELPRTADGDKALELIGRGDLTQCSFIYSTDEDDSENCVSYEKVLEPDEEEPGKMEEVLVRHVKRIDKIYDFTLTDSPAYEETSVSRREVESHGIDLGDTGGRGEAAALRKREAVAALRRMAREAAMICEG